ncbi:hypothetical protein GN958_ATG13673 [Phytophthora infestans]|uniref:Uncharacterized protein n=1 Tax=Phytophthora infestans TaxID=4787 RepID=A0A8S9UDV1_PHYIN|nr:hypothetical protein GN958_ATG13673 [Phytophthora infestans]
MNKVEYDSKCSVVEMPLSALAPSTYAAIEGSSISQVSPGDIKISEQSQRIIEDSEVDTALSKTKQHLQRQQPAPYPKKKAQAFCKIYRDRFKEMPERKEARTGRLLWLCLGTL